MIYSMITSILMLNFAATAYALTPGYSATQAGNILFIKTPWGSTPYIGPVGFETIPSYSFEISLSDYRAGLNHPAGSEPGQSPGFGATPSTGDEITLIAEANRLYSEGDFNRALEFVDEACRRNSKNSRAWVMKGSLMHVLGHEDLAHQAWEKALALEPGNVVLQNLLKEAKK